MESYTAGGIHAAAAATQSAGGPPGPPPRTQARVWRLSPWETARPGARLASR